MHLTHLLLPALGSSLLLVSMGGNAARAQNLVDEALASAYPELKADPELQDEQARHRKLMEMAEQYSQFAEAAFQATADLQDYAAKARATGLIFRTPLGKIKQFDKGLKRITEHPAFKSFQKYGTIKGQPGVNSDCTEEMILQFACSIGRQLDEHFAGGKPAVPPF